MEMIARWRYLNTEQIALLLNKHIRAVDTLLRDLMTKKLVRVDPVKRKTSTHYQV